MKVKVDKIASDVATLLGESLALECHPAESPFPNIEDRVRIFAPGFLASMLIEPKYISEGLAPIECDPNIDKTGCVTVPMPADFLKLVCIRMSDWERDVTEIEEADSETFKLQGCRWEGVRGNPHRPVAISGYDEAGKPCLRLYSSNPSATLTKALYMPRPEISGEDSLEIPKSLYYPLIARLANKLSVPIST